MSFEKSRYPITSTSLERGEIRHEKLIKLPSDYNVQHRVANPWPRRVSLRCGWPRGRRKQTVASRLLHLHPSFFFVPILRSHTQALSSQRWKANSWAGSHLDFTKAFGKRKGKYYFNFMSKKSTLSLWDYEMCSVACLSCMIGRTAVSSATQKFTLLWHALPHPHHLLPRKLPYTEHLLHGRHLTSSLTLSNHTPREVLLSMFCKQKTQVQKSNSFVQHHTELELDLDLFSSKYGALSTISYCLSGREDMRKCQHSLKIDFDLKSSQQSKSEPERSMSNFVHSSIFSTRPGWTRRKGPRMDTLTLVRAEGSPRIFNCSKRKPSGASVHMLSGPTRLQDKLLTCLPMPYLVNLSWRFQVQTEAFMSTWLHSSLIPVFSPTMLLQDTWKVYLPRWLTQIECSIPKH